MMLLFKIAELVIVFLVIRSIIRFVRPSGRNRNPEKKPGTQPKRFDEKSHDISDGEYEEL